MNFGDGVGASLVIAANEADTEAGFRFPKGFPGFLRFPPCFAGCVVLVCVSGCVALFFASSHT